jgi:hypothetical protein
MQTDIVQAAGSVKEIINDPRVAIGVNLVQRVNNMWSLYRSHKGLKGIRKQESRYAQARKIRKILQQRHLNTKVKLGLSPSPSKQQEMKLEKYAAYCFLLEIGRLGTKQVPLLDAAAIVGTGLLSAAEEKKIQRFQTEEKQEKSGWECKKARYRQIQYAISMTAKMILLVSSAVLAMAPQESLPKEVSTVASRVQTVATVMGVIMSSVTAYENRTQIAQALGSACSYLSSCLTKVRHER